MSAYSEKYYAAEDGLRLYYRDYSTPQAARGKTAVLCIPGLTRNSRDFDFIASYIAQSRRVLSADLRGRGKSAYDPDGRSYAVPVETSDMLRLIEDAGTPRVVVLGTSRGGVIAMTLAAIKPDVLSGTILNDIGARLEAAGLERIYAVLRSPPSYQSWEEAVVGLKHASSARFPNVSDAQWRAFAQALYREREGRIVGDYDPRFPAAILEGSGTNPRTETGAADLWRWFNALGPIPTLVLRGDRSELLSEQTVAQMHAAKPDLVSVTVKDRGHVPFLDEPEAVAAIDGFLKGIP
jgi:pimeloyl-ACP methyl ester carboxylesterase